MVAEYNTQWFWRRQTRRTCRRVMSYGHRLSAVRAHVRPHRVRRTAGVESSYWNDAVIGEQNSPETGHARLGVRIARPGEPTSPFAFQAKARLHIRPSNQARQARVEARDGVHITTECPHIFKRIELVPECWMIN